MSVTGGDAEADQVTVTLSFWVPPPHVEASAEDLDAAPPEADEVVVPPEADEVVEDEAPGFFAASPARLQPIREQEGGVAIACGDVTAGFADTLLWLGPSLCLDAVDHVLDSGTANFALFGSDTQVTLRRDGETIRISADIMDEASFPAMPLLVALAEAGQRLVDLVEKLWPEDEEAKSILVTLSSQAKATKTRLYQGS